MALIIRSFCSFAKRFLPLNICRLQTEWLPKKPCLKSAKRGKNRYPRFTCRAARAIRKKPSPSSIGSSARESKLGLIGATSWPANVCAIGDSKCGQPVRFGLCSSGRVGARESRRKIMRKLRRGCSGRRAAPFGWSRCFCAAWPGKTRRLFCGPSLDSRFTSSNANRNGAVWSRV